MEERVHIAGRPGVLEAEKALAGQLAGAQPHGRQELPLGHGLSLPGVNKNMSASMVLS